MTALPIQKKPLFGNLFSQGSFTIDPDATPEQLARKREMIEKVLSGAGKARYVGEGVADLAAGILGGMQMRKINEAEKAGREKSSEYFKDLIGGGKAPNPFSGFGFGGAQPSQSARNAAMASNGGPTKAAANAIDLRGGIIETAESLGIDPVDLATAISYETAGTFDPTKAGPTTQWGQHRGLIQFGEPQAKQYGVDWDNPVSSQLGPDGAVAKYLRGAGVKPGMGMMDIYSAINAGSVGRYNASDANNGGAPGSVRDKVKNQMSGHRDKALSLIGDYQPRKSSQASDAQLYEALADPWLTPDQKKIISSMLVQRQEAQDPERQLSLEKSRLEIDRLRNAKPERKTAKDVNGVLRYVDTGDQVFEGVTAQGKPTSEIQEYQYAVNQGFEGSFVDYQNQKRKSGAPSVSTTVNTGDQADSRPLMDKPPKGFQAKWNPEEHTWVMEPVPGGPAALEIEAQESKKAESGRQQKLRLGTTLENLNLNIAEIEDGGIPVTGMIGKIGRLIPGSAAADFSSRTRQINTRAALDEVQNMRDNSPTGGAVGQLTDGEREAIGQAATSLNEAISTEEYLRSSRNFRKLMLDIAYGENLWTTLPDGSVVPANKSANKSLKYETFEDFAANPEVQAAAKGAGVTVEDMWEILQERSK